MMASKLRDEGRPDAADDARLAILVAGDDAQAKARVMDLVEEIGFAAVDTGSLAEGGRRQQPGSPIYGQLLTGAAARAAVAD